MVVPSMIAILVHGVEILLTLVTRILKQSGKVFAFHMPSQIGLLRTHMSTDVALELSTIDSLTDLFNVVVQIKVVSPFLTHILIPCILVHFINGGMKAVHQLTGTWLFHIHISINVVVFRARPLLFRW